MSEAESVTELTESLRLLAEQNGELTQALRDVQDELRVPQLTFSIEETAAIFRTNKEGIRRKVRGKSLKKVPNHYPMIFAKWDIEKALGKVEMRQYL